MGSFIEKLTGKWINPLSKEYKEGFEDGKFMIVKKNPYTFSTVEYDDFNAGWFDGMYERINS